MPYLNWESELKSGSQFSFESEHWNLADLFLDYFKKRWEMEKEKHHGAAGNEELENSDFIYASASAKHCVPILFRIKFSIYRITSL